MYSAHLRLPLGLLLLEVHVLYKTPLGGQSHVLIAWVMKLVSLFVFLFTLCACLALRAVNNQMMTASLADRGNVDQRLT